jgi:hypothetical protein
VGSLDNRQPTLALSGISYGLSNVCGLKYLKSNDIPLRGFRVRGKSDQMWGKMDLKMDAIRRLKRRAATSEFWPYVVRGDDHLWVQSSLNAEGRGKILCANGLSSLIKRNGRVLRARRPTARFPTCPHANIKVMSLSPAASNSALRFPNE